LINYFKKAGPNGNKNLLAKVQQVSKDDIYRVLTKFLKPLVEAGNSNEAIATSPAKVDEFIKAFDGFGRTLKKEALA
jgi:hypothetical protein